MFLTEKGMALLAKIASKGEIQFMQSDPDTAVTVVLCGTYKPTGEAVEFREMGVATRNTEWHTVVDAKTGEKHIAEVDKWDPAIGFEIALKQAMRKLVATVDKYLDAEAINAETPALMQPHAVYGLVHDSTVNGAREYRRSLIQTAIANATRVR